MLNGPKIRCNLLEFLYVSLSLFVIVCSCLGLIADYRIMSYILFFIFAWIARLTLEYRNFSLYQVFLTTYFFFLLGRIFLTCIGVFDFRELGLYQSAYMNEEVALETVNVLLVFLIGTSYGWLMVRRDDSDGKYFSQHIEKTLFDNSLRYLYYIYTVLFGMKMLYLFVHVRRDGYLSIFNGDVTSGFFPIVFIGAASISELLFIIMLFYNRDSVSFKKYSLLYIVVAVAKMFTGQRGYFFVLVVFLIYMWSTFYKEIKYTSAKIISALLAFPLVIQWIWNFRYKTGMTILNILRENVYVTVLKGQGVSMELVADTIIYKDQFVNEVPFFFGYITDFFKKNPAGQVMEDITTRNYFGDHLTFTLNPDIFFVGHGTGTSIVAEIYELFNGNLLLIFLAAMLITYVVLKIAKRAYKSIYWYGISFYLVRNFIFSPRDSVLKHIPNAIFVLAACYILTRVDKTLRNGNVYLKSRSAESYKQGGVQQKLKLFKI